MSRNGRANDFLGLWREGKEYDGIDYGSFDSQDALEFIERIDTKFADKKIARIAELEAKNEELSGFFDAAYRDAEYFRKERDAALSAFKIPDDDGMTWLERANVVADEIRGLRAELTTAEAALAEMEECPDQNEYPYSNIRAEK